MTALLENAYIDLKRLLPPVSSHYQFSMNIGETKDLLGV